MVSTVLRVFCTRCPLKALVRSRSVAISRMLHRLRSSSTEQGEHPLWAADGPEAVRTVPGDTPWTVFPCLSHTHWVIEWSWSGCMPESCPLRHRMVLVRLLIQQNSSALGGGGSAVQDICCLCPDLEILPGGDSCEIGEQVGCSSRPSPCALGFRSLTWGLSNWHVMASLDTGNQLEWWPEAAPLARTSRLRGDDGQR